MGRSSKTQPRKPPKLDLVEKIQSSLKFDEENGFVDLEHGHLDVGDSDVEANVAAEDGTIGK